jgi:hypothetical protein
MYKLNTEAVKYLNMIIDQRTPLSDDDREFMAASIIQATPRPQLPSVHDMEPDDKLLDMLAGYMKSADPDDGQAILDYLVNNIVTYYNPTIDGLIEEKRDSGRFSKMLDREDQARWAKNR